MDFEELRERYKLLPIWARMLIALALGLIPAGYIYFDQGDALAADLEAAHGELGTAQTKLEKAITKKKGIPVVEERLMELDEQMRKAKAALPDSYHIEDILQKTATIAKETGVKLALFNPEEEKDGKGQYRYKELPIATEIDGKFNQVAAFFDRLVHLEHSLFIRALDIAALAPDDAKDDPNKSDHDRAKETRAAMSSKAKFQIVLYRSMTEGEIATAEAAPGDAAADLNGDPAKKGKKKKKPKDVGDAAPAAPAGDVPPPPAAPGGENAP